MLSGESPLILKIVRMVSQGQRGREPYFFISKYWKALRQTTKNCNSLERHYGMHYSPLDNMLQHLIYEHVNDYAEFY